ncbi:MAG TPA: hypothetical protein VNI20_06865, partial [Fimbriimonadaceae bacterium]|nr:hypothetical protein [Fimbriimonadaceae bacterium]
MNWTVDYGEGPQPVSLPHAWRQDVPVKWEGPAIYRTEIDVAHDDEWLVFEGVSFRAEVLFDGEPVAQHEGIWDAFSVPLRGHQGRNVNVEVRVTKNGGETFPVRRVLSGFLPYVFNTFGGIYGAVRVVRSQADPCEDLPPAPQSRVVADGTHLMVDGKPFFMRGVLSWGWYPELGHTNPTDDDVRQEVSTAKSLGFNTIKFCLWVPRHRFFEILEEEGMFAWLELPLWDPDPSGLDKMEEELGRIVRQFRRHSCIVAWTVGCELSGSTPPEFRRRLVQMVKDETGCPLVKDNSGGAEMYGGDLREFGTFDDFHPYCDTHFYPPVLESLRPGAREQRPILLGEFCDFDVHRDLARLKQEAPYWASADPALNDQGVRWQYDLPRVLAESRWANCDNSALIASSKSKRGWVRSRVMEAVYATPEIAGFVVTGWRHTPVSTSGLVDDALQPVYGQSKVDRWNRDDVLFLVPYRRPPW